MPGRLQSFCVKGDCIFSAFKAGYLVPWNMRSIPKLSCCNAIATWNAAPCIIMMDTDCIAPEIVGVARIFVRGGRTFCRGGGQNQHD